MLAQNQNKGLSNYDFHVWKWQAKPQIVNWEKMTSLDQPGLALNKSSHNHVNQFSEVGSIGFTTSIDYKMSNPGLMASNKSASIPCME